MNQKKKIIIFFHKSYTRNTQIFLTLSIVATAPIGGGLFNSLHSSLVSSVPSNYQQADKALISVLSHKNIFSTLPGEIRNLIKTYEGQYELSTNATQNVDPGKKLIKKKRKIKKSFQRLSIIFI